MNTSVSERVPPVVKLYWWRLGGKQAGNGNFGDEITREIIETVFHCRVEWAPVQNCQIIGAGSIVELVTENKGANRPYLWGSGFIRKGALTISPDDYKIIGVRGRTSKGRVADSPPDIVLGDPGLLASRLLGRAPGKQYPLGILPHYVDLNNAFVRGHKGNPDVLVIDPTLPCVTVVEQISTCEAVLSSSLHGLIVSDSLAVPNLHLKLSNNLLGGTYKFNDYYSIYNDARCRRVTPEIFRGCTVRAIREYISNNYKPVPHDEMKEIKDRLVRSFPSALGQDDRTYT